MSASDPAVGIDVASVSRVAALLQRQPRFAARVFTAAERRECARLPQRWASRWAAKEAVRKLAGAMGLPLPAFADVEVTRGPGGAPRLVCAAPQLAGVQVSLTYEGDLAVAIAAASTPALEAPPLLALPEQLQLAPRPDDAHKGTFGTVVVLAGAHGLSGAAYLAAMGAARGGAGLVRLCVPRALQGAMAVKCTEVMPHGLEDGGSGVVGEEAVAELRRLHLPVASVLVTGPGLGRDPRTETALLALLGALPCPTVVDADGLNIAAAHGLDWRRSGAPVVLTPHPAEMARLLGAETATVQGDRRGTASGYARERGAVVVLKGSATVVAAPDGRVHVGPPGVVALATGGTGDVLAGLVGAMLSCGLSPFDAAVAAVTIHAEAGREVQRRRGRAGALATDVLEALPEAQERIRRALERRA